MPEQELQLPDRLDLDNPDHRSLVASDLSRLAIEMFELAREHTGEGHRQQNTTGNRILRAIIPKTEAFRSSVEQPGKFVKVAKQLAEYQITNFDRIEDEIARQWKVTNAMAELALAGNTVIVLLPHSEVIDTAVAGINIFSDMEDHGIFDENKPHMTRGIIVSEMTNSFVVDFDKENDPHSTSVQQGHLPGVDDMLGLIFNHIYKSFPTDTESMARLWRDPALAHIMRSVNARVVEKLLEAIRIGNLVLLIAPSASQDRASEKDPNTIRMHRISDGTVRLLINNKNNEHRETQEIIEPAEDKPANIAGGASDSAVRELRAEEEKKKYVVALAFRIENETGEHTAKYLDMPKALKRPYQVHRLWHKMARVLSKEQTEDTKLKFKYDGPRWWQTILKQSGMRSNRKNKF